MKQKTVTEKRFGEYHEDDKSVTIRSKSGTCGGGGQRYSLSAISENSRNIVRHGLQVGAARTSRAGKVDSMCEANGEVICLEVFHCTTENEVAQPLKARDYKDPLVVSYELSESNGQPDGKRICEAWNTRGSE